MVEIDVDDYEKGIKDLKFSVVGHLIIRKGDVPLTTLELKEKL